MTIAIGTRGTRAGGTGGTPRPESVSFGLDHTSDTALWVLFGQASLVVSLWFGFGVMQFSDTLVTLATFAFAGMMVMLSPSGTAGRIVLTWPVLVYLWWWLLSTLWTNNLYGWQLRTLETMPSVVVGMVVASMLPTRHLLRALVFLSTAMILYQFVPMLLSYSTASVGIDPLSGEILPGWRGSFGHKNSMAPAVALGILIVLLFAKPGWVRRVSLAWGTVLVAMSLSATGLAALLMVGSGVGWYRAYRRRQGRTSTAFLVASVALGTMVAAGTVLLFPWLIGLYGKDVTLSGRTQIWAAVWKRVLDKPVTGHGIGGAWVSFAEQPTVGMIREVGFFFTHSHNGLLDLALMLGFVGAGLWLVIVGATIGLGARLQRARPDIGQLLLLFPLVLIVVNVSEVAVYGSWFSMLVICRVLAVRARLDLEQADEARRAAERRAPKRPRPQLGVVR